MAKLVMMFANSLLGEVGKTIDQRSASLSEHLQMIQILSSGFIVTSLLWGSAMAAIIDRRLRVAAIYFAIAGVCSLFGVIHSPFADECLQVGWNLPADFPHAAAGQTPLHFAACYLVVAIMLFCWAPFARSAKSRYDDVETSA